MNKVKKVPVYRQLESIDCGPTCVRMISAYYGRHYKLKTIKQLIEITRIGVSSADIIDCFQKIGIDAVCVQIPISKLLEVPLPAVLYWRQGHYVVLDSIKTNKLKHTFYVIDPEYGKVKLSDGDFALSWLNNDHGIVIIAEPNEKFNDIRIATQLGNSSLLLAHLRLFTHKYIKPFSIVIALSIIALIANWVMPILFQKTIDNGVVNKNIHIVWVLLGAQLMCFLGYVVSNLSTTIILTKVGYCIGVDLISEYLRRIISLPMKFFDTRFGSDLIQRLNDQDRIKAFLTSTLDTSLFTLLNLLVFSGILLYYNMYVFLLFAFFSSVSIVWTILFIRKRKYVDYSLFTLSSIQDNNIYELVHGMPEIKINNAQTRKVEQWTVMQNNINLMSIRSLHIDNWLTFGSSFFNRLKDIIVTGLCAFYVIYSDMTIGTMMTISYLLGQLSGPINQIMITFRSVQNAKLSYDRLDEINSYPIESNVGKKVVNNIANGITLNNISFKYEGSFSPYVLKDVNLHIERGKITAIVGISGSGKTTLIKLLLAFYSPQQGEILLDKQNLSNTDSDQWRQKCGAVMQDGYIYSGTIAENIAIADENPDIKRVEYAAHMACIDNFINELPMKYHTKIGKMGIELSGGQKQRLFIARAVYKNPEFIFFDEATSSLDANNEREIMTNLSEFYKGKTVVIVAHRLSTVKNADKIVFLDKGRVVEEGTHDELSAMRGAYYHLVKNQLEMGK